MGEKRKYVRRNKPKPRELSEHPVLTFKVLWRDVDGDIFEDEAKGVTRFAAIEASRAWMCREMSIDAAVFAAAFVLAGTKRVFHRKGFYLDRRIAG